MKRPNIIHFHAESWDGRMLGAMGHPALRSATPNIDRIAGGGVLFENAYCSHPICCPSRANMWSGRYTHNCESWNNYKGLERGMWSLLGELPKTHTVKTLGKLDYLSGGHTQVARLGAWLAGSRVARPVFDEDDSQSFTVADDANPRFHARDWGNVDEAVEFMAQQKGTGEPFFLSLSSGLVHAAFNTNRYWLDRIPEDAVDIPATDDTDHPVIAYQRLTKAWRYGFDEATVRQVRRIYFAMCAEADALVGALYDAMNRLGLAENTYFVFTSDHGELALEHQDWYKMSLYEGSVRVPFVVSGPGLIKGVRIPNLVSLIDLCPTFEEMAGIPETPGLDGESVLPLAAGYTEESRNWAYSCFTGITLNSSAYMLRKDRWKYIAYPGYPGQLFDLENDPGELHDLTATEPELVARLDGELRRIVDYERTHRDLQAYNKEAFRQWRRQAKRGLHVDASYGLKDAPSRDYRTIMDNCFTGYDDEDERTVDLWLESGDSPAPAPAPVKT